MPPALVTLLALFSNVGAINGLVTDPSGKASAIEVGWNAGQQYDHAKEERPMVRSERKKGQRSSLESSALHIEHDAESSETDRHATLLEGTTVTNHTSARRDSEAVVPCAFVESTGTTSMQCLDDSLCDPVNDAKGWMCCASKGGRKKCPVSSPLMCAFNTCQGDHCCDTSCATYGGLRHCGHCIETLAGFRDDAYRGCQRLTRSGKRCQRWDAQFPHVHTMTPAANQLADLREDFCRNPDGQLSIWCYTAEADTRWEFCDPMATFTKVGPARCSVSLPLVGSRAHGRIPDAKIKASSYTGNMPVSGYQAMWRARMDNTGSTWTAEASDSNPWIEWDFGSAKQISKVQTKGRPDCCQEWVSQYRLAFSPDGDTWTMLDDLFEGNQDKDTVTENTIDPPITASMLRLFPTSFSEKISLRAEVFGCSAPGELEVVYHNSECCTGNDCDESTELPDYVSWQKCHDQCETSPDCMGFQFGKDNLDSELDRCTSPDLCACWLVKGGCTNLVVNRQYDAFLFKDPTETPRLVMDGQVKGHKGRLEVFHNGEWGSVCADGFSTQAAMVVCAQKGLTGGTVLPANSFPQGAGSIWMDNVVCSGHEHRIWNCNFNGWGTHNCEHTNDAGVECNPPATVSG